MLKFHSSLVVFAATVSNTSLAFVLAADCNVPVSPNCAPPPYRSCRPQAGAEAAYSESPARSSGVASGAAAPAMFAAPPLGGEISGERHGLTLPAIEFTLPAITLQTPQLRILGASRQRRDAFMTLDGGRAPMATGAPAMYSPVTGAGLPVATSMNASVGVAPANTPQVPPAHPSSTPASSEIPPAPHCAPPPGFPLPAPASESTLLDELQRARFENEQLRYELAQRQRGSVAQEGGFADTRHIVEPAAAWESNHRKSNRPSSVGSSIRQLQDPAGRSRVSDIDQAQQVTADTSNEFTSEPQPDFTRESDLVYNEQPDDSQSIERPGVSSPTKKPSLFRRLLGMKR